jgi:hypothetical protein
VADDLCADLDQLLAQAGQRPRLRCLRHRQGPHKVAEIVGKSMKLKAHRLAAKVPHDIRVARRAAHLKDIRPQARGRAVASTIGEDEQLALLLSFGDIAGEYATISSHGPYRAIYLGFWLTKLGQCGTK